MSEILLQGADQQYVTEAITLTRKMRSAIIWGQRKPEGGYICPTTDTEQRGLRDAEELAFLTATFLLSLISSLSQSEEREKLANANVAFQEVYGNNKPYSYAKEDPEKAVNRLTRITSTLNDSWQTTIYHHFTFRNQIPLSAAEMMSGDIGIVAPLSTDFHQAMIAREFLAKNVKPETFTLKPAVIQPFTSEVVLPLNPDGQAVFSPHSQIGIYVDVVNDGDTARGLYEALNTTYKGKTIYSPVK